MFNKSGSANHAEHSVKVKPSAKTRLMKLGMIIGALVFIGVFYAVFASLGFAVMFLLPAAVLLIFLVIFLVWFFWKYTNLEYDYIISGGKLTVSVIYSSRVRKNLVSLTISEAELIADCDKVPVAEEQNAAHVYRCLSTPDASNKVYMVYKNENGEKCVVYFEYTQKMLKLLRFYNMQAYKVTAKV